MRNQSSSTQHEHAFVTSQKVRPTNVCLSTSETVPLTSNAVTRLPLAGAIGKTIEQESTASLLQTASLQRSEVRGLQTEAIGDTFVKPARAEVVSLTSGVQELAAKLKLFTAAEPQPQLQLRVRAIYAVDDGTTPQWQLEHVRNAVSTLVEAANRDLIGTGFRFVCFVKHDVEIRHDTKLRQDAVLSNKDIADLASGKMSEAEGDAMIAKAANAVKAHRNAVAAEKPHTMLWIFSRGSRFEKTKDANGKFRWKYLDDRGGSFSGGDNNFVALHEGFLSSIEWARQDASRAVHEVGHYLGLPHTHREPFHDLSQMVDGGFLSADVLNKSASERLTAWREAIAKWLENQKLPSNASPQQAQNMYDADRGADVLDTPPDPGAGLIALANEVAGHGSDNELGPVTKISLEVSGVNGTVNLEPLRDNPMGYYLRETPDAMRFTSGQVKVMRGHLIDGGRRHLVAAQLGDSATPDLRVCAVWSPNANAQRLTWGYSLEAHKAEHEKMRQSGMFMTHQQAYTRNGTVLFDGIWDVGKRSQEILWGWLDEHVKADLPSKLSRGMLPVSVQAYSHLNHGIRYNIIYEAGSGDARLLLGVTQDELSKQSAVWMPKGYRMSCLSSHVDKSGIIRYSTVFRPGNSAQSWITGWTLDHIAQEYSKKWSEGWRIRHITVVKIPNGHRWSAVFEPDKQNQLVYWAHVRERIGEVYDEMWAQDFKLRSMCVVPA